jgi:hypothetical protein
MFNKVNYTKYDVSETKTKDRIGNHLVVPHDCFSAYPVAVTAVPKVAGMKPSRIFIAKSLRHHEF